MERNFDRRRPGVAATLLAASCWACSVITAAPVTLPHVGDTSESSSRPPRWCPWDGRALRWHPRARWSQSGRGWRRTPSPRTRSEAHVEQVCARSVLAMTCPIRRSAHRPRGPRVRGPGSHHGVPPVLSADLGTTGRPVRTWRMNSRSDAWCESPATRVVNTSTSVGRQDWTLEVARSAAVDAGGMDRELLGDFLDRLAAEGPEHG